ncbi:MULTISPECIES: hypothetical protein [unclassified Paraflavitalea]|uniref:hypothetical protein n=1 Tax=unclassified Paraflavitalea TaxID=2798305 RepID=UPI003D329BB9
MSNILKISDLNDTRFYDINPTILPQYLSKHFDLYQFAEQIPSWQSKVKYFQKKQTSDITVYQFESNFDPIVVEVVDRYGIPRISLPATKVRQNKYQPTFFIYEASINWSTLSEGCYWVTVNAGSGLKNLISEPISLKANWPNTLYYEYSNSRYHGNVFFETGIVFKTRIEGRIGRLVPNTDDVVYEDDERTSYLLKSTASTSFELYMGGSKGLPDWMIQKINAIWTCNNVRIDGKSFSKSSETKLDLKSQDNYPMRGITMIVKEGLNRGAMYFSSDADVSKKLVVVHNIDSSLFGDTANPGSNVIQILSNE